MSDEKRYETSDGERVTLEKMVRVEPEWAASRIRAGDAAIAERDRLREIMTEANVALDVVAAERDRLRRELEAWRESLGWVPSHFTADGARMPLLHPLPDMIARLDAILRGES